MFVVRSGSLSLLLTFLLCSGQANGDVDLNLQTPDLIKKYGYPVETHTVTTQDGYILTVHRIPSSPVAEYTRVKTPVFLQHGFMLASDIWVATGLKTGLGFLLADHGYDVWLGNARGNIYSRKHLNYSSNDKKYWDFSWHEMGLYDLPAVIDYILKATNHKELSYVGYSMGSTMFFVMASSKPQYNQKIRRMVALAPVVFNGHLEHIMGTIDHLIANNVTDFLPGRNALVNTYIQESCTDGSIKQLLCAHFFFMMSGYESLTEFNATNLPLYMSLSFSGTSKKTLEHFYQIFKTDQFQMFDRKARVNGHVEVQPNYKLDRVTAPIDIIYAQRDIFATPQFKWNFISKQQLCKWDSRMASNLALQRLLSKNDKVDIRLPIFDIYKSVTRHNKGMEKLKNSLPNVHRVVRVKDDQAGHGVFIYDENVVYNVYDHVFVMLH